MAYLFCEEHGREHEAETRSSQEHYRREGETVLAVKGRLISGPWRCDRCNAVLKRGRPAWLFAAFPRWVAESIGEYEFKYERRYFAVEHSAVAVYGAEWPGVACAAAVLAEADG
jgi:hypothetical protein